MILFLYGTDSYRLQERLQFLRTAFIEKYDEHGHNVVEVDTEQFDIANLHKHLKSGGLFATKRFIVVRHLWKCSKEEQDQLQNELEGIDADTILCIVTEPPPRKNNALFSRLLKADSVEEYANLSDNQLRTFIQRHVKNHSATIESSAVEELIARTGNNLWKLSGEIKKMASFTKQITSITVAEFTEETLNDNIFQLTDAIGQKNVASATNLLEQQFVLGANTQYLITMLGKHIANVLKVKRTEGKGIQLHPYVIQKSLTQAKLFSDERLLHLYYQLLQIDEAVKTTTTNEQALLELFVTEACTVE